MWTISVMAMVSLGLSAQAPSPSPSPEGLAPAGPWQVVDTKDGITVKARPITGQAWEELQASVELPVDPATMLELMWGDGTLQHASPGVTARELLPSANDDVRLYYEVVAAPLISPRDYVLRVQRQRDPAKGPLMLRFVSVDDARRPPHKDRVRMPLITGSSVAEAVPGRPDVTRVVHTVYSDVGGAVPAWAARGGQRDSMFAWLKELRRRAEAARKPAP